ncbi:MAG: lipopolysaccharide biosynthesis protein [Sphingomonas sp.]
MTGDAEAPAAARTRFGRLGGVIRNLGWLLAGRGVTALLSLVYLAIVTRTLGVTDFGRFAIIVGASQVLTVLVGFQTWQIIVRYGTAHLQSGDARGLGRLFRACTTLDAFTAVAGTLAAAVILSLWGDKLGIGETLSRATLLFTVVQLLSIRSTPLGILRLRDRFSFAALADSTTPIARSIGAALVMLVHPTLQGFLVAWMVAELLTSAAYWTTAMHSGRFDPRPLGWGKMRRVMAENPGFTRFALSTNASSTLSLSGKQIPLLLVGGMAGTAAAGEFRLAAQLAQSLTKLSQLLARAAFPEIVRSVAAGRLAQIGRFLVRSVTIAGIVSVVVFALVLLIGRPVLALVGGQAFAGAYPILLWLVAAGCVDLATVGFEPVLMAADRAGQAFFVRLVATAMLIGGAVLLTPQMGATGIAGAMLIYSLVMAALMALLLVTTVRAGRGAERPEKST